MNIIRQGKQSSQISILLPIYNGEKYITPCLESILHQEFQDFEVIIVDDGSTDQSIEKVLFYEDQRITLISCEHNYICSLNTGLGFCSGKYIARMDIDDCLHPNRLKEQIYFLEENPDITLCASYMKKMHSKELLPHNISGYINNITETLLLGNPIAHPTVMMRRDFLTKKNLKYRTDAPFAEDYQLWVDMAKEGASMYILPIALVEYRTSKEQVSTRHSQEQQLSAYNIRKGLLEYLLSQEGEYKDALQLYFHGLCGMVQAGLLSLEELFQQIYIVLIREKNIIH